MDTKKLKKFAAKARKDLIEQVGARLDHVLSTDSAELREKAKALSELKTQISATSKEAVTEKVAYIWFNRFCALRFMDANRYTRVGVLSPAEGGTQPEVLAEAKQGVIDDQMMPANKAQDVFHLLAGKKISSNPQSEAYRSLIIAACNLYNRSMPFMFERIEDYSELLMPDDLLSDNSILAHIRETMDVDSCKEVEIIGWLYQYYIAEKKDEVFAALKKNKKITAENIPAATQLFTPHYIVRYLVENSLGRLWMLNNPKSNLTDKMNYYIAPEEPETEFLEISSPEEIKICDPACGSGHMLTYAFDLLYAIYEECGYDASDIPTLILTNNLFGIELDDRAGALAAFALVMKARAKQRRFLDKGITPNICVLQNIELTEDERRAIREEMGADLITGSFNLLLSQFEEADNFGSLIRPAPVDIEEIKQHLQAKAGNTRLFFDTALAKMNLSLEQADYLSPKYHVMIANPPYMGGKGMNGRLGAWAKSNYPNSKSDLFAMFMERGMDLILPKGMMSMINMQSWMFLSSFEKLRTKLLDSSTILTMAHLGARAFDSIGGEVVSTTAFIVGNQKRVDHQGDYLRLVDGKSEAEKKAAINEAIQNSDCVWFFRASTVDFEKIPGYPIAYWLTEEFLKVFAYGTPMQEYATPRQGFATGNNDQFLRQWPEVSWGNFKSNSKDAEDANASKVKWFPCNKGGSYRKWYGNNSIIANWQYNGFAMKSYEGSVIRNPSYYFREGITWSTISSSTLSMRYSPLGFVFETKGSVCFPLEGNSIYEPLALMNSKVVEKILLALSPTLDFHEGPIGKVPVIEKLPDRLDDICKSAISIAKLDWDSIENSWEFLRSPLLSSLNRDITLESEYSVLSSKWSDEVQRMQKLEEESNRIFINAYELSTELDEEVDLSEITLTCNPHYRYPSVKSNDEKEEKLLADTMKEFISYAVGCMFGRYALEKEGLVLADQGDTIDNYMTLIPAPSFPADEDNVVPMLDGDWFSDDISDRFKQFLRITFGEDNYEENLQYIEDAIGKNIRKYFLKDFYNDHVKRYKKRPIYWMFSSPKGSFNALIYMHRYRPDNVSVILNDYLREYRTKLEAKREDCAQVEISASASQADKNKALQEISKLDAIISELNDWEHDVLYPLATQKIEIELDDGVKANYPKFGAALKNIKGLS